MTVYEIGYGSGVFWRESYVNLIVISMTLSIVRMICICYVNENVMRTLTDKEIWTTSVNTNENLIDFLICLLL